MTSSALRNPYILLIARIILAALFIWASFDKAINPMGFAKIIWNYRITPPALINIAAVILPWVELLAGLLLILGYKARGANLIITGLLIFYIALLSVTMFRGINVACGCFTTSTAAKSNLLVRIIEDVGMLILAIYIFAFYRSRNKVTS